MTLSENYQNLINIAIAAGQIIVNIRESQRLEVNFKGDNSPVTLADYQSNAYITQALQRDYPNIPIISEETDNTPYQGQDIFFLIDPLDGTRDFIAGTNDYCVNIALVYQNMPILGIIYLPESHECYYAIRNKGSYKIKDCNAINQQKKLSVKPIENQKIQTISRRSNVLGYYFFNPTMLIKDTIYAGSAKKFCLIAEGIADIYPRPGLTGEWDTASGDLIVTEAGGYVRDKNHQSIIYGKDTYLNDAFYAANFVF
jgi:3'(2'), 5'-bisphosphate nucleotidase